MADLAGSLRDLQHSISNLRRGRATFQEIRRIVPRDVQYYSPVRAFSQERRIESDQTNDLAEIRQVLRQVERRVADGETLVPGLLEELKGLRRSVVNIGTTTSMEKDPAFEMGQKLELKLKLLEEKENAVKSTLDEKMKELDEARNDFKKVLRRNEFLEQEVHGIKRDLVNNEAKSKRDDILENLQKELEKSRERETSIRNQLQDIKKQLEMVKEEAIDKPSSDSSHVTKDLIARLEYARARVISSEQQVQMKKNDLKQLEQQLKSITETYRSASSKEPSSDEIQTLRELRGSLDEQLEKNQSLILQTKHFVQLEKDEIARDVDSMSYFSNLVRLQDHFQEIKLKNNKMEENLENLRNQIAGEKSSWHNQIIHIKEKYETACESRMQKDKEIRELEHKVSKDRSMFEKQAVLLRHMEEDLEFIDGRTGEFLERAVALETALGAYSNKTSRHDIPILKDQLMKMETKLEVFEFEKGEISKMGDSIKLQPQKAAIRNSKMELERLAALYNEKIQEKKFLLLKHRERVHDYEETEAASLEKESTMKHLRMERDALELELHGLQKKLLNHHPPAESTLKADQFEDLRKELAQSEYTLQRLEGQIEIANEFRAKASELNLILKKEEKELNVTLTNEEFARSKLQEADQVIKRLRNMTACKSPLRKSLT